MALRSIDQHAHFTRGDFATLLARNVASDMRAALSHSALKQELWSILRFRYNQLAGTYQGFNGPSAVSAELRERFYYPGGHGRARHSDESAPEMIDYPALEAARRVAPDSSTSGSRSSEDGGGKRHRRRGAKHAGTR
jgi:hypothetical protein